MELELFTTIDTWVDTRIDRLVEIVSHNLASDLGLILNASITLYVVFYAYMTLAGKIQEPVKDLVWNLAKFAFLIGFMNNMGGYLTLSTEAVKGLASIGTGGTEQGFAYLDSFISKGSDTISKVAKKAGKSISGRIIGFLVSVAMWAGMLLAALPAFMIIITNKIVMYFLLGLAPLFIFTLMWGWLKESFNQYLGALLSNALVIVVVSAITKGVIELFQEIQYVEMAELNMLLIGASYIILGVFATSVMTFLAEKANGLMRVSIETIPSAVPASQAGGGNGGKEKRSALDTRSITSGAVGGAVRLGMSAYRRMKKAGGGGNAE